MPHSVTLNLPDELAARFEIEAKERSRPVQDVVVDWLERSDEADLGSLSDTELLSVCDSLLNPDDQDELSDLLERTREGQLDTQARPRLGTLMTNYQQGLLRKARAWRIAVARGLRTNLD